MHGPVLGGQGIIVDMPHFLPLLKTVDHVSQITVPAPERPLNRSTLGKIRAGWRSTPRATCLRFSLAMLTLRQ